MIALLLWKCFKFYKSFWIFHFHSLWPNDHCVLVFYSFSLLWSKQYSYCPHKPFFILELKKFLQILLGTFHFYYLWFSDHQMLVLFHFHFCDVHNIHIIFLSLLLFWNFKKSFKSFWGPSIFTIYDLVITNY
jgi:hypothetical protein